MMLNGEVKTPSFVIFHKSKRDDINSKKVKLVTKLDFFSSYPWTWKLREINQETCHLNFLIFLVFRPSQNDD